MGAAGDIRSAWERCIRERCSASGLKTVGGFGYRVDDPYLAVLVPVAAPDVSAGRVQLHWTAEVKPLVLDQLLWNVFMPGQDLGGPRKQLSLRVNGTFAAPGLTVGSDTVHIPVAEGPATAVTAMVDEFRKRSGRFVERHPDVRDYRRAVQAAVPDVGAAPRARLLQILTLLAAGDRRAAARVAEAEVAAGEMGPMYSTQLRAGVFELLARYCR